MVTAALGFDMTYARVGLPSKAISEQKLVGLAAGGPGRPWSSRHGGATAPAAAAEHRPVVDLGQGRRGMGGKRTVEDCGALPLHSSTNEATRTVRSRSRGNASDHVVGRSRSTAG
jgi:hypothetical protein